jgi:hypothetical protein
VQFFNRTAHHEEQVAAGAFLTSTPRCIERPSTPVGAALLTSVAAPEAASDSTAEVSLPFASAAGSSAASPQEMSRQSPAVAIARGYRLDRAITS